MSRPKRPRVRTLARALAAYERDCDRAAFARVACPPCIVNSLGPVTLDGVPLRGAEVIAFDAGSAP